MTTNQVTEHRRAARIWIILIGAGLLALLVLAAVSHQRDVDRQNEQSDSARRSYCMLLGGAALHDCLAGK